MFKSKNQTMPFDFINNRLIQVRDMQTDEILVRNRYDAFGRRREKIENGITNRYVYDGWLVLAVLDGANNVIEQYVHGPDLGGDRETAGGIGGILGGTTASASFFYHYDGNGNVTATTDESGDIVSRLEYDPFGRILLATGNNIPRFQFSSKEYDETTGLNYYGYRFYSPTLGRWPNRDPIEEAGGWNLYTAVFNSTINLFDPHGNNIFLDYDENISGDPSWWKCFQVKSVLTAGSVLNGQTTDTDYRLWMAWLNGTGNPGVSFDDFDTDGVRDEIESQLSRMAGNSAFSAANLLSCGERRYFRSGTASRDSVSWNRMITSWKYSVRYSFTIEKKCVPSCKLIVQVDWRHSASDRTDFNRGLDANKKPYQFSGGGFTITDRLVNKCNEKFK